MKIKIFLGILAISALIFFIYEIRDSYGLFETNNNMIVDSEIGKWNVYVGGSSATSGSFIVDSINIMDSNNVKEGKLAPSTVGYFDIVIDPRDTSVSIRYDISFDFSLIEGNFSVTKIDEMAEGNLIKTGENTYSKVIPLLDINNGTTNTIRVYVKWDNIEEDNDSDSVIGGTKNNYINIPVTVTVSQYLGEDIKEYADN